MGTRVNGIKNNLSYVIVWLRVTFHWSETIHQVTTYLGSTRPLPGSLTCFMDPWQPGKQWFPLQLDGCWGTVGGCAGGTSPPKRVLITRFFFWNENWKIFTISHHLDPTGYWSPHMASYHRTVIFGGKVKLQNPIMTGNDPHILFKRPWRSAETEEKPEMDNCFYKAFTELQELIFFPLLSTCL